MTLQGGTSFQAFSKDQRLKRTCSPRGTWKGSDEFCKFHFGSQMFLSDYVSGKQFALEWRHPWQWRQCEGEKLKWLHFSLFSTAAGPVKESFLPPGELCVLNVFRRYVTLRVPPAANQPILMCPDTCYHWLFWYFGHTCIYFYVGSPSSEILKHDHVCSELIPWCFVFKSGHRINFITRDWGSSSEKRNLTDSQSNISCGETSGLLLKGFGFFWAFFFFSPCTKSKAWKSWTLSPK